MSALFSKFIPVVLLALAAHAPGAHAQAQAQAFEPTTRGTMERLHAEGVASFRDARFPAAFARFIRLADAGHAPSAEMALWMYLHGPSLFGKDWDSTQEQLTAWAKLARQPVPTLEARVYPQPVVSVTSRRR